MSNAPVLGPPSRPSPQEQGEGGAPSHLNPLSLVREGEREQPAILPSPVFGGGVGGEGHPFDAMAADYDANFTHSRIGALMRQAVNARMEARFLPGSHILELNCGTGEDAVTLALRGVRVTATDVSCGMLEVAREKAQRAGVRDRVAFLPLPSEEIGLLVPTGPHVPSRFDGALSNFGGLNCVENLRDVAVGLAISLKPGSYALLCMMGPLCPWEWLWYLRKGQPEKAFRRLRPGGVVWRGLTIRYPSIGRMQRLFAPEFRLRRVSAVGALLPPTYMEAWSGEHPRLLRMLNRWERRGETLFPLPQLADHYLLEMERI